MTYCEKFPIANFETIDSEDTESNENLPEQGRTVHT